MHVHVCIYGIHDTADTSSCHPHNGLKIFGEILNKQELRCGINVVTILCVQHKSRHLIKFYIVIEPGDTLIEPGTRNLACMQLAVPKRRVM